MMLRGGKSQRIKPSFETAKAVSIIKIVLPKIMERKNKVSFFVPDQYGFKVGFVLLEKSVKTQFC